MLLSVVRALTRLSVCLLLVVHALYAQASRSRAATAADFSLDEIDGVPELFNYPPLHLSENYPLTLSGWALDREQRRPAVAVDIVIDGISYRGTYGIERPELAHYFKDSLFANAGFELAIPAGAIAPGAHQLTIRIWQPGGKAYLETPSLKFFIVGSESRGPLFFLDGTALMRAVGAFLLGVLLLWIIPRLIVEEIRRGCARNEEYLDVLAIITAGVLGYGAFWVYYLSPIAGHLLSFLCLALGAALAIRRRTRLRSIVLDRTLGVVVSIGILYIGILSLHGPSQIDASFVKAYLFFEPRSMDNLIPLLFAKAILKPHGPHIGFGYWLYSDRPPLQTGLLVYTWPIAGVFGKDNCYQAVGLFAQLFFVFAVKSVLQACGAHLRRIRFSFFILATSGFVYFSSVYVWPKLLGAAFCLIAAGPVAKLWLSKEQFVALDVFIFCVATSLSLLCHGGDITTIITLLFLGLVRFGPVQRLGWRMVAPALILMTLLYLPWLGYQKLVNPPGTYLIKYQLAGHLQSDNVGVFQSLREAYTGLSFSQWRQWKESNLKLAVTDTALDSDILECARMLLGGQAGRQMSVPVKLRRYYFHLSSIPATWHSLAAFIRYDQVEQLFRSLGLLNVCWLFLIVGLVRKRSAYLRTTLPVFLLVPALLSLLLWWLLLYRHDTFLIRNIGHSSILLLFMAAALLLYDCSPWVRWTITGIHVLFWMALWICFVPTDYAAAPLLLKTGWSVPALLVSVAALVALAHLCLEQEFRSSSFSRDLRARPALENQPLQ